MLLFKLTYYPYYKNKKIVKPLRVFGLLLLVANYILFKLENLTTKQYAFAKMFKIFLQKILPEHFLLRQ